MKWKSDSDLVAGNDLKQVRIKNLEKNLLKQPLCCSLIFLFLCFSVKISYAEDTLSSLMQRMKSKAAVKIEYREMRSLELMDQPWFGKGYMYSLSPNIIIKEQLQPQRVLMGVDSDKLFYFDVENNVRHQGEMDEDNPLSLNILVFKALITADEALLQRLFAVEFSTKPLRWMLSLKPKKNDASDFNIVVSGLTGQEAELIRIEQADGDVSEFLLKKSEAVEDINKIGNQLVQELKGE